MNTTGFLTIATAIVPDRPSMIFEDSRITYAELEARANRLSNSLAELGVGAGDRVAMLQVNCNQYIEAYFATARLDAVYVPLNFRARADELTHMLNDARAQGAVRRRTLCEPRQGVRRQCGVSGAPCRSGRRSRRLASLRLSDRKRR